MINSKTRTTLSTIAAIGAALVPVAAAQAATPNKCRHAGSTTVAQSGYARVYGTGQAVYVCVKRTGRSHLLTGASPNGDVFTLGGQYVGFSASTDPNGDPTVQLPPHSVVTVMRIPDGYVNPYWYPFETNETIDKIVVASDGAAAWALTPPAPNVDGSYTIVQGTDRLGNPADQLSDDHTDLIGTSLNIVGKTVSWSYTDGTTGSQSLF